jgi:ABC-2 type transport system ATP-binding protein
LLASERAPSCAGYYSGAALYRLRAAIASAIVAGVEVCAVFRDNSAPRLTNARLGTSRARITTHALPPAGDSLISCQTGDATATVGGVLLMAVGAGGRERVGYWLPMAGGASEVDGSPIAIRGLSKSYGRILAVDGIDLTVKAGDIYGFLGPNGAGKTTAMRILLGLLHQDAGEVRLFGRDPQRDLPEALDGVAGFVETPHFYPYLSGRTNLELFAAYDGGEAGTRVGSALDTVGLESRAGDKVGDYSQGMRQRLGLAVSLLREPRLLILDEPTNGLDPGGIRDMRDLIKQLAGEGMTIFLSSHLLAEVEELCTRVAVIHSGRIVYEGSLAELHASAAPRYRLRTSDQQTARRVLAARPDVRELESEGDNLVFVADEATVLALSRVLVEAGLGIAALQPESASLERLFFELTEGGEHPLRLGPVD